MEVKTVELRQYVQLLWRWLWLIVAVTIVGGLIGLGLSRQMTPTYQATTTLLVNQGRPSPETPRLEELQVRTQMSRTIIELLYQRPILEETIANLQLPVDTGTFAEQIQIGFLGNSDLIVLTVEDSDPYLAAEIANEIVQVFNQKEAALIANPYAINRPSLHVVEPALPMLDPVQPRPLQYALLAAFAAAIFGVIGVLGINYFDRTIRSSADVSRLTGLQNLAEISRIGGLRSTDKLIARTNPASATAEQYRMTRPRLEAVAGQQAIHSLLVTSANPREGKSTSAANLAIALAQTGMRVVLIDADLRRPVQHTLFNKPNTRGLSTLVQQAEHEPVKEYLLPTDVQHLYLLPSGPVLENPSWVFASEQFKDIVDQLKTEMDIIILDSPALLSVADAQLLLHLSDATVLIVEAQKTQNDDLQKAYEHIHQAPAYTLGFMLNRATRGARGSYYSRGKRSLRNIAVRARRT